MHSYNSPAPLVSTDETAANPLRARNELLTLPTVQGVQAVQGFDKNSDRAEQLCLLISESERDSKQQPPPILFTDDELPAVSPFLIEPVEGGRFKLYANNANRQEYAGYYYDFEVAYFLKHWPRPPAPSVAEFMAVAEQVISRGYVPPSQMGTEQIQVLRGIV